MSTKNLDGYIKFNNLHRLHRSNSEWDPERPTEETLNETDRESMTDNSSYIYYKYDLSGYTGFRITGTKASILKRVYLNYYK